MFILSVPLSFPKAHNMIRECVWYTCMYVHMYACIYMWPRTEWAGVGFNILYPTEEWEEMSSELRKSAFSACSL